MHKNDLMIISFSRGISIAKVFYILYFISDEGLNLLYLVWWTDCIPEAKEITTLGKVPYGSALFH